MVSYHVNLPLESGRLATPGPLYLDFLRAPLLTPLLTDQEPQLEVIVQLSQELHANNIIQLLIKALRHIDFEVQLGSRDELEINSI